MTSHLCKRLCSAALLTQQPKQRVVICSTIDHYPLQHVEQELRYSSFSNGYFASNKATTSHVHTYLDYDYKELKFEELLYGKN